MYQHVYKDITRIDGSITEPQGFLATGGHIGIKKNKADLTLIKSKIPAIAAGVFTQNQVKAACINWNKQNISNKIHGIVVNSGNANACTGEEGTKNNELMAQAYADSIGCTKEEVLVASTGLIGAQLPINIIESNLKNLKLDSSKESSRKAAEAIMTTDTVSKEIAVQLEIGGKTVKIGGIAKGSGMIHPNMATMLAFITTDAAIERKLLQKALSETVNDTYNMISVDGDTSTNDMVIVLANGAAKNTPITSENEDYNKFKAALYYVNEHLAKQIVSDGEGVTKFLEVHVSGAVNKVAAQTIAKTIINSNLVKTALFGSDANWGRILCAAGYSGVQFDPDGVSVEFSSGGGSVLLFSGGKPVVFDEEKALQVLKENEVKILFSLEEGTSTATAWGCDLSYEYVKINGEYRT